MKLLIIYYSYQGNTRAIAEAMAKAVGADIKRLIPRNEKQVKGFMKYLWGGKQVFMNKTPDLEPIALDPADYDIIFLGSPVWAFTYAPAMNSFLKKYQLKGKKLALFCCHGGGKGAIFNNFKKALPDNEYIGEIDFFEPLTHRQDAALTRACDWAHNLFS